MLGLLAVFAACNKAPVYLPDPSDIPNKAPLVTVVYDPGALGDLAYNDYIYEGVERAAIEHGLRTHQFSPRSREEGLAFLAGVFERMEDATDTTRQLLIVAGSSYDEYVRANNRRLEANPRADLLYFETREPLEGKGSSIHIRFFGAMYEAGAVTPFFSNEVLVVAANPYDVADALAGFQAGFATGYFPSSSPTERKVFLEYLSDESGKGFSISDEDALHLIYEQPWSEGVSGVIVPLCGGGAATFRRLVESEGLFSILGIDKPILSTSSWYSAVKYSDQVAELCIGQWLSEEGMPKHQSVGREDYYTEMLFNSPDYDDMDVFLEYFPVDVRVALRQDAIEKEAEYERMH